MLKNNKLNNSFKAQFKEHIVNPNEASISATHFASKVRAKVYEAKVETLSFGFYCLIYNMQTAIKVMIINAKLKCINVGIQVSAI